MDNYNKDKDLTRILVEGTKAIYGAEKAEQLDAEFERRRQQPAYRGSAEELTAIVDRVCGDAEVSKPAEMVGSIDEVVDNVPVVYLKPKVGMAKVIGKTTWNLAGKSCWYYPIFGALPGVAQKWLGKKLGDNPVSYTKANMAAEIAVSPLAAVYIAYMNTQNYAAAFWVSMGALSLSAILNYGVRKNEGTKKLDGNKVYEEPAGSFLLCTPLYVTAAAVASPFLLLYAMYVGGKKAITAVKDSYHLTLQEEQQKLLEKKPLRALLNQSLTSIEQPQSRIEQQPEITLTPDGEKFEYDEEDSPPKPKHHSWADGGH